MDDRKDTAEARKKAKHQAESAKKAVTHAKDKKQKAEQEKADEAELAKILDKTIGIVGEEEKINEEKTDKMELKAKAGEIAKASEGAK